MTKSQQTSAEIDFMETFYRWGRAENQRKVYKIYDSYRDESKVKPGTTHEAIVLDDQHVKIV